MPALLRATLVVLALLSTAACTSKPVLNPSRTLPANVQVTEEQMKQTVLATLIERKWTVQQVNPQLIQAKITVRDQFHAEIDIRYTRTSYSISYRSSRDLDFKDGKIHRNYNRWVSMLDKGILKNLQKIQANATVQQYLKAAKTSPAP